MCSVAASRFGVDARCSADFLKDVMDVPELQRVVRARETQVHGERLQNAQAQVVSRRGVCWFVGQLRVFLLAQFLLAERRATKVVLGREWNGCLHPGEETGSRRNLVVMDLFRPWLRLRQQSRIPPQKWTLQPNKGRSSRGSTSSNSRMLETLCWRIWLRPKKAEKETLRRRLQEYKPTSQRLKLAQDAWDKAARKHRQVGEELEALRLLLDAKAQARREATLALELAQLEADTWAARLRREQEQVIAVTTPTHGMCNGRPQLGAAG